jgi:single-strand DNA-binding protein
LNFATSERVKDGDKWVERTEWHRVVCFGKTADNVQRYCQKGKQLYIEGRIQTRKWQDKEGKDRWSTEIVARDIKFLGGKSEGGYASPDGYSGSNASTASDDVPF